MRTRSIRRTLGATLAALGLAALAGPVAAAAPEQWTSTDTWVVQHDCGVVETTTATFRGKAFFEDGAWVRDVMQADFNSVFVGPTGKSFSSETHQNGIFTETTGSTSGQGTMLRAGGQPIHMDNGRLVFQLADGTTIMSSAKAVPWDDPAGPAHLEAALCARLG